MAGRYAPALEDRRSALLENAERLGLGDDAGPFLDAPRALLDGIVEIAMNREAPPYFPWERLIRLGILALLVGDLIRPFRLAARWRALGRPRAMAHTVPVIGRVLFDIALAAAIPLWIVLGLAKLPIQDFLEFHYSFADPLPDLVCCHTMAGKLL